MTQGRAERAVRDTAKLVVSQFGAAIFAICFSAWLVRSLPAKELSIWPVWLGLSGILQALSQLGMRDTFVRLVPQALREGRDADAARILRCGLFANLVMASLLCAAFWMMSGAAANVFLKAPEMGPVVRLVMLAVFFTAMRLHLEGALSSVQQFGTVAVVGAICRIGQSSLAVAAYLVSGIQGAVFALIAVNFVACALALAKLWKWLQIGSGLQGLRGVISYAGPFWGVAILSFLTNRIDYLVVAALTVPELLASYYVARKLASYVEQVGEFAMSAVAPKLAELRGRPDHEARAGFCKCTRYAFLGLLPVRLAGIALGPALVLLYAGDKYASAGITLSLLCGYIQMSNLYALHRAAILAFGRRWHLLALQAIAGCLNPLALVLFVPVWGGPGAAVGKICVFFVLTLVGYYLLRLRLKPLYDYEAIKLALIASSLMAGTMGLWVIALRSAAALVPAIVTGVLVYLVLLRHRLTEADARLILSLMPPRLRQSRASQRFVRAVTGFLAGRTPAHTAGAEASERRPAERRAS